MGLTKVTVKLGNPAAPERSYEALFLVDTGATDCLVPGDELRKIGVREEGRMAYELADGQVKEYGYGLARIEFMGEITAGRIVFGEANVEPILGVTALESVGIMAPPTGRSNGCRPSRSNNPRCQTANSGGNAACLAGPIPDCPIAHWASSKFGSTICQVVQTGADTFTDNPFTNDMP